ncbi:MAG: HD domain-containing protein [Smithellaceae bacterium]|nr:HD domain-containing protein [Syntrophaceae bacterium]MDD4241198.1 HD domain-containing protein [Smithellaceae bacterium]NLX51558.1 HD domain-containing protein [Deltaproteobacteria bacterium]
MKTKDIYLQDIKPGDKIASSFLAADKSLAFSQKGSPYLNVRLKDKTGETDGKIWDNAVELDRVFKKGDIIFIEGRAQNYRNALQISIVTVKPCAPGDVDPADYQPVSKMDIPAMFRDILAYIDSLSSEPLQKLLWAFFHDEETADRFRRAPAAKGFHHIYLGGLLEHTLSVVRMLDRAAEHYPHLNRDLLIAGGILHDIGKIYEFNYDGLIAYSDEGRMIGHLVMGVEMIDKKMEAIGSFPPQLALELRHIILSHHGEFEFGSPKRPKTMEALVIHFMDDLDAKLNAFQSFVAADAANAESDWTAYNRFFERYLFKGR